MLSPIVVVTFFSSKEIKMRNENISHTSTDDNYDNVKVGLLVAGVTILAASTLVIATWAGLT
jgi:hypothetical protein